MPKLVLTTVSNLPQAHKLAGEIVEKRLAACVSLIKVESSVYKWKGHLEKCAEVQLLIKTSLRKLPALQTFLKKNHPYELPEFLVLNASASQRYGSWLKESMK